MERVTNEERRDVAARLREVKKTWFDFTWCKICMAVCGPDCPVGCDEDEMAVDVAKRLADLIEPETERKAKSKPFPIEEDTGYFDTTKCECGYLNDVSATYCGQCGGVIEVVE